MLGVLQGDEAPRASFNSVSWEPGIEGSVEPSGAFQEHTTFQK